MVSVCVTVVFPRHPRCAALSASSRKPSDEPDPTVKTVILGQDLP